MRFLFRPYILYREDNFSSEYQTIGTLVGFKRPPDAPPTDYSADPDIQNFDDPLMTSPAIQRPASADTAVPHPSQVDFLVKPIGVIQGR